MKKRGRKRYCFTYEEASHIVQSEGISSKGEYTKWWKYNLPARMPKRPDCAYRNCNFSWTHFLGKGNPFPKKRIKYRSYEDAKKFAQTLGFTSKAQWIDYAKTSNKPENIPSRPDLTYKKSLDWISWKEFLGYNLAKKHDLLIAGAKPILYIAKLPNRPGNIFKFGITLDNVNSLISMHKSKSIVLVKCFYLNNINYDWMSVVNRFGSYYEYGTENEYIIFNIAEVISYFSTYCSQIFL